MKLPRYKEVYDSSLHMHIITEDDEGDWVTYEDIKPVVEGMPSKEEIDEAVIALNIAYNHAAVNAIPSHEHLCRGYFRVANYLKRVAEMSHGEG